MRGGLAGAAMAALAGALAMACVSDRAGLTEGELIDCQLDVSAAAPAAALARLAPEQTGTEASDSVVVVGIRGFDFTPRTVEIPAGGTVVWVNCEEPGTEAHTVTSDAEDWGSELLSPGQVFVRRFPVAGEYAYHCIPHPSMRGTVEVSP